MQLRRLSLIMREDAFLQLTEFHIASHVREVIGFDKSLFSSSGNVVFSSHKRIHEFVFHFNKAVDEDRLKSSHLDAGYLALMGLIDEIFHYIFRLYRKEVNSRFFIDGYAFIDDKLKVKNLSLSTLLKAFSKYFPNEELYNIKKSGNVAFEEYLDEYFEKLDSESQVKNKYIIMEELILLILANENPAFAPFYVLFDDSELKKLEEYQIFKDELLKWSNLNHPFGKEKLDIISFLKSPILKFPNSLEEQFEYIKKYWQVFLTLLFDKILEIESLVQEVKKIGTPIYYEGEFTVPTFQGGEEASAFDHLSENKAYSPDRDWMAQVVMIAKNTFVYLDQLSKKYKRDIKHLHDIPDDELKELQEAGITALWLIGLWQRSFSSQKIKVLCGNPDAIASAYSIYDYKIASELGGDESLNLLKQRAFLHGIRLIADMVPNHTAIDSVDVIKNPHLFLQTNESPYPSYNFFDPPLSTEDGVSIYLENHYYSKEDCAVVFKRVDNKTGDVKYIYHGNDGTGMPWNDTAQLDFLNKDTREMVINRIIEVAKKFSIIRFDAAMVITQRHIRRLWYPSLGKTDSIPSRAECHISDSEFKNRMPNEFWREVVDRIQQEVPDTLLLAEAFWMLEGYFVRTLGMHRVYNSAFMNMLKKEENEKYRQLIKNTLLFDKEILKRYVNFMSNPDEEVASLQFGKGDKYFGVCTMMVSLPGLPMFAHGQIVGMEEKYGMEYKRAYKDEGTDEYLLERHKKEIFPLLKMRHVFSQVENFHLYDFISKKDTNKDLYEGSVNENVFAWSNRCENIRALIFYNNKYECASGNIHTSVSFKTVNEKVKTVNLIEALNLSSGQLYYTIFFEMHSSLYYIRSNKELEEKGFFAMLRGFESQVFINIEEVMDKDGTYKKLNDILAGSGVHNIEEKIKTIKDENEKLNKQKLYRKLIQILKNFLALKL